MPSDPSSGAEPVPSDIELETAIEVAGEGIWTTHLSRAWHIGDASNGGYAMLPVLRALRDVAGHPDPISVTTHFLRPGLGDIDGEVRAELIRSGRRTGTARGRLVQDGATRLEVMAAFSDLSTGADGAPELTLPAPDLPAPEDCVDRSELAQGVELPILSRVDVRLRPEQSISGGSDRAVIEGWIRLRDGTPPTSGTLPLFADAFPPSLYPFVGNIGWVPTIELTVHVRRRPAPGWVQARLECDDLQGGRMIESGALWDSTGALVARSRQIGLLLAR
ncbi:MAG: thioesterase family protein [Actinomycetota bacterium]